MWRARLQLLLWFVFGLSWVVLAVITAWVLWQLWLAIDQKY